MASVNLLASLDRDGNIEKFAADFFAAIGAETYEERESGSYVDGRYFKAIAGTTVTVISVADEVDHGDLPIWVQVTDDATDETSLTSLVDSTVQIKLLPKGFKCARILNFGRQNEQRIDYLHSA